MSFATKPTFVLQPFANNGLKNSIPNTTTSDGYASYDQGFPEITMQPKESGGLPPRGQDMNGILNNGGSKFDIYQQMGGTYSLNTDILSNGGYAKNSVVYQDDGAYRSMVDNNTDNFITTPSVIGSTWQLLIDYNAEAGSNGVPLQMSYFARTDVPTGWLRCDGTQYNRASFPNFYDEYLLTGKAPTLTYTEYNLEVSDNGSCGSFALDSVNLTFKVPTIAGEVFIAQALASGDIAKFVSAGLPDHSHNVTITNMGVDGSGGNGVDQAAPGSTTGPTYTSSNASLSNSIYGNSTTVTPNNIQYPIMICVANVQVPVSEAQYNGFISNLTLKADIDLENITETAKQNISTLSFPSDNYDDLALGASGSTYTAPADGWYCLNKLQGIAYSVITWRYGTGNFNDILISRTVGIDNISQAMCSMTPVKKGQIIVLDYSATGSTNSFRFYYANNS